MLQDGLDALPTDLIKQVVCDELRLGSIDELFTEFSEEPLGSASIAQVHAATLRDGKTKVAVKVQRPGARALLLADVANLKRFAKLLADALPVDYYTVFSELGAALEGELDFLQEAQAMDKLRASLRFETNGEPSTPPLRIPRAIPGLASRKVLVMEFMPGKPLSKLRDEARARGVDPESPEARYLGNKIVTSLGEAYARMIFNGGFTHGDPHPGNIFVDVDTLDVGLIDCGQTKQLSLADRVQLREVVVALQSYRARPGEPAVAKVLADEIRKFGVELRPRDAGISVVDEHDDNNCLVAIALLLFGDKTVDELPGGYDRDELSANSPLRRLASFPQSLVLVGRAAVLIRGIAATLNVPYSLSSAWVQAAIQADLTGAILPPWARERGKSDETSEEGPPSTRHVLRTIRAWTSAKVKLMAKRFLPRRAISWFAARALRRAQGRFLDASPPTAAPMTSPRT